LLVRLETSEKYKQTGVDVIWDFSETKTVNNGKFVDLALDEDNQSELTEERIKKWISQLKVEFEI
jgi:flavodoxin I